MATSGSFRKAAPFGEGLRAFCETHATENTNMQPHEISAHHIADALETIARELRAIQPIFEPASLVGETPNDKARRHIDANMSNWIPGLNSADKLEWTAMAVRSVVPFVPLDDDQKQELFEQTSEELADMSTRDRARDYMDVPDWQLRADYDERQEQEGDD
jgi:hypothetical protein